MSDQIFSIDSRVVGFSHEPVRVLSLCYPTGEILIQKVDIFTELAVTGDNKDTTIVVTDAPDLIQNWDLKFNAQEHLETVINMFQLRNRAGLIEIEPKIKRFDPTNVLQVRKVDKRGLQQEFDSSSLSNGHMAVLLSVWASHRVSMGSVITSNQSLEDKNALDRTMLPFSI